MRTILVSGLLVLAACDPDLHRVTKAGADASSTSATAPEPGDHEDPGANNATGSTGDGGAGDAAATDEHEAGPPPGHVIDGTNDFTASETLPTSSTVSGYHAYAAWDDKRIYLGYSGQDIGSGAADRWVLVYVEGSPGTTKGLDYGGAQQPTLPFSAGYHVRWKADGSYTNAQKWNGSAWVDATGSGLIPLAAQKGTFMEMSLSRVGLGSPSKLKIHMSMIIEGGAAPPAGDDWTYAGVPSTSFVDGKNPAYGKYLEFDLGDTKTAPNAYVAKP